MKKRNSNIELLRIVAMIMILASHMACHGIQHCKETKAAYQIWNNGKMLNKLFVSFLNPGGMIGVACFFMITGYFMIEKTSFSLKRVTLQGIYYGVFSIVTFLIAAFLGYKFIDVQISELLSIIVKSLVVPNTNGGCWWFLTAYIYLMLLTPLINSVVSRLNKNGYIVFIIVVWFFVYSLNGTLLSEYWQVQRGVMFYLIGGYIRKCVDTKKIENGGGKKLIISDNDIGMGYRFYHYV